MAEDSSNEMILATTENITNLKVTRGTIHFVTKVVKPCRRISNRPFRNIGVVDLPEHSRSQSARFPDDSDSMLSSASFSFDEPIEEEEEDDDDDDEEDAEMNVVMNDDESTEVIVMSEEEEGEGEEEGQEVQQQQKEESVDDDDVPGQTRQKMSLVFRLETTISTQQGNEIRDTLQGLNTAAERRQVDCPASRVLNEEVLSIFYNMLTEYLPTGYNALYLRCCNAVEENDAESDGNDSDNATDSENSNA
ncbi:acidic leucine-rich nuclear phosphoprotein 32 family member B [Folsomia candida]|uniref:acidic leucine-rich nuclear phosphoprotein 32 family member B n=1 Tax=Folsomia candida TaxID=158441 RepID=UPI000B8F4180|nr:acidic leucine-rich nuclear phosphoprotein 32 family member B [Folsomia candida]